MKKPVIILALTIVFAQISKAQLAPDVEFVTDFGTESTAVLFSYSPINGADKPSSVISVPLVVFHAPPKHNTVLLDYYFNNEWKKNASGNEVRFHYVWEDSANSGYSVLGQIFRSQGMQTGSLETAPAKKNLKKAGIYIIVDPDTE
jgi:hypothetical protein